jgi:C1A family cysteine protease/predicted secreted protein
MLKKRLPGWILALTLLISGTHLTYAAEPTPPPTPSTHRSGGQPPFEISIVLRPDGTWEGEAQLALISSSSLSSEAGGPAHTQIKQRIAAILGNGRVRYAWGQTWHQPPEGTGEKGIELYTLDLEGEDAREIVQIALDARFTAEELAGPVALDVHGVVQKGQAPEIALPGNPATGYSWQVASLAEGTLVHVDETETQQLRTGLGTPARHVIRFRAAGAGQAGFRLLYQRPWETDRSPRIAISIAPSGLDLAQTCAALSLPSTPPVVSPALEYKSGEDQHESAAPPDGFVASGQTLPSTFDWCDQNGCTPVKDQGECGSCWAFATVGALESALQLWQGLTTDLAEQYLVSCNTDGWGCNGGWWAHDYHQDKIPPSESQAGAVLESSAPYQALDIPCGGPYSHPYRIVSWQHVGSSYGIPSVEAIKQAIYTHGPVAVAICVDTAFHNYSGGVFQTNEVCEGDVNHAVLLVGWDDSVQAWLLRNSWGPGWGENGYMRIRYGTSNVGYAANYVTISDPFHPTDWVYLPLVVRNVESSPPPTPTEDIPNGGFENGRDGSWNEYSSNGWALIYNASSLPLSPHGGSWAAWLGGDDDETSILSQQISIPSNATTLNYWYWTSSEDFCYYDYAYTCLGSSTLKTHNLCADENTAGWTLQQLDVTSWRGQTLDLSFVVETDYSLNSNFFLDDVSISAAGVSTTSAPHRIDVPADLPDASASKGPR